jgi:hypothetical protein
MPRDRSLSPPTHRRRSRSPERYNDRDAPSRSPGAPTTQAPPAAPAINLPKVVDIDPFRRRERERQLAERALEEQTNGDSTALTKKSTYDPAAEFAKLVSTRSGGAYIPPSRLRAMQKDAEKDKRTFCSSDHESSSFVASLHPGLFGLDRYHQYQVAHGRRIGLDQTDQSVQESLQA